MYRLRRDKQTFSYNGGMVTIIKDRLFETDDKFLAKFKMHFEKVVGEVQTLNEVPVEVATVEVTEIDYNTLETKEELLQYVEDNNIDIDLGNTRSVAKIKAKIKAVLEV